MPSSFNESEIIIDSFRKGAINYITKSNYSILVSAIREAYEGKASLNADIADAIRTELQLTSLTPMEREVYQLRKKGLNNSQIAQKLIKSLNTVKSHVKSIRGKIRL